MAVLLAGLVPKAGTTVESTRKYWHFLLPERALTLPQPVTNTLKEWISFAGRREK